MMDIYSLDKIIEGLKAKGVNDSYIKKITKDFDRDMDLFSFI